MAIQPGRAGWRVDSWTGVQMASAAGIWMHLCVLTHRHAQAGGASSCRALRLGGWRAVRAGLVQADDVQAPPTHP